MVGGQESQEEARGREGGELSLEGCHGAEAA